MYNLSKTYKNPSHNSMMEMIMTIIKIRTGAQVEIDLVDLDGNS